MNLEERLQRLENNINRLSLLFVLLVIWLITNKVIGEERRTTPADATGWALSDIAQLQQQDRPFQRYIFIPSWGDKSWQAAINFTVNTACSHASIIQLGTPVANGWMIRYDLRRLAPTLPQLQKLITTWDSLALQDSYFHITATTLGLKKVPTAILAPHLKQREATTLASLSLSTGSIYRADWFIFKALSTLEGGAYYDFLQVQRQVEKGRTQQGVFLASLGIYEEQTKLLSADQRTAVFRSGVTGKPRRVDVFYGLGRGGNLCTITHDSFDEDIEVEQNPIRNLLRFQDRAREVIVERPNGTHAFILFNSNGEIQNSVPDNVATDHLIPAPFTKRLQPAISCIRCHSPFEGYQHLTNDVQTILSSRLDVFSDLASKAFTREQVIDQLAGLYAGQLDTADAPLGRGRRDYLSTVYKIVGDSYPEDQSVVSAVGAHTSSIYSQYRYDLVTPAKAALELGLTSLDEYEIQAGEAVDPVTGSLKAGISVNRFDFEHVFADMSLKANVIRGKEQN